MLPKRACWLRSPIAGTDIKRPGAQRHRHQSCQEFIWKYTIKLGDWLETLFRILFTNRLTSSVPVSASWNTVVVCPRPFVNRWFGQIPDRNPGYALGLVDVQPASPSAQLCGSAAYFMEALAQTNNYDADGNQPQYRSVASTGCLSRRMGFASGWSTAEVIVGDWHYGNH